MGKSELKIYEMEFSVRGILKYLTHLEILNFFSKLFVRIGLPVRFSAGFNPRPKISIPVPKPTGIESLSDLVRAELLHGDFDPEEIVARCRKTYPESPLFEFSKAWITEKSRLKVPVAILWEINLADTDLVPRDVIKRIECQRKIIRKVNKSKRVIDVQKEIMEICYEDPCLRIKTQLSPAGTLKPTEIGNLIGLDREECYLRMRRSRIIWK